MTEETDGERVCRFITTFCMVPEGPRGSVGRPMELLPFQREFILALYDNPEGTARAYLSMPRKNGKTALIACLALAHIAGPMAVHNSQIISGARSREQGALVYKLAEKMVNLSPTLKGLIRATPSRHMLTGLVANVEFKAISAEAGTAHGLSPVVAILDEVGQVKGPHDPFVEAIETAQGAYDDAILIAISTQAASDGDLFSLWLDSPENAHTVKRLYTAPEGCDVMDEEAWKVANPALGAFRSLPELRRFAEQAEQMPSAENSFRWLYLNQRVAAASPFISRSVWRACGGDVVPSFDGYPVFGGLDLSTNRDLTAFVAMAPVGDVWHVKPTFWLPADGLREKSLSDRVPYDVWARDGVLQTTPGPSIDYDFVADFLWNFCQENDVRRIGFDRWGYAHLKPRLAAVGFGEEQLEGDDAIFQPIGQGFQSMSPALLSLEAKLLQGRIAHGDHPVLTMCAHNTTVAADPAGNRKPDKMKSHGRIDGMVALAMADAMAGTWEAMPVPDVMAMIA